MFSTILNRSIERRHLDIFALFPTLIGSLSLFHSFRIRTISLVAPTLVGMENTKIPCKPLGVIEGGAKFVLETEHLIMVSDCIHTLHSRFGTMYLQSVSSELVMQLHLFQALGVCT